MDFDIPNDERELLRKWLTSPDPTTDAVLAALEKASPSLKRSDLTNAVAAASGISAKAAGDLTFALYNLSITAARVTDKAQFTAAVLRNIVGENIDGETRRRFEDRVARILSSKTVEISGKALRVLRDNVNHYCGSRVLSELRPVFDNDLDAQAMVIVHNLKLIYHTGPEQERQEIYVSMDRSELGELIAVMQRALQKDEKLADAAEKLQLKVLR